MTLNPSVDPSVKQHADPMDNAQSTWIFFPPRAFCTVADGLRRGAVLFYSSRASLE